jgi:hypothetical protein
MAPADRRTQRLMPGQRVPAPAGQQPEPVVEPRQQLPGRQRPQPPRRQLDGKRNPVEPPAQLPYVRVVFIEDDPLLRGPVGEQLHRLVLAQRRQRDHPFTRQLQRPPPHREHPQPRHPPEQLGHQRGTHLHQMLEPVQHQQQLTIRQMREQRLARQPRGVIRQPQRLYDREVHEFRVAHRRQLHPPHPVRGRGPGRRVGREPRLADPAGPGHRDQTRGVERPRQFGEFGRAAHEPVGFEGQIAVRGGVAAMGSSHGTRSVLNRIQSVQSLRPTPPRAGR